MSFLYRAALLAGEESMWNHWRLLLLFVSPPQHRHNDLSMGITAGLIHQSELKKKKSIQHQYIRVRNGSKNKCSGIYLINAGRQNSLFLSFWPWSCTSEETLGKLQTLWDELHVEDHLVYIRHPLKDASKQYWLVWKPSPDARIRCYHATLLETRRIQLYHFHNTCYRVPMFTTRPEGTMAELQVLRVLTMARVRVSTFVSLKTYFWHEFRLCCDQNRHSKQNHDVVLTLSKCFLCLNVTKAWEQHCDTKWNRNFSPKETESFKLSVALQKCTLPTLILDERIDECHQHTDVLFPSNL